MTKKHRIRARIERDKQRRQARREVQNSPYDDFKKLITTQHYISALKKCNRSVGYKRSVQEYNQNGVVNINTTIRTLESGKLPALGTIKKVNIRERGKERVITPIRIDDRITQRVLCDYALVPVIGRTLIYDNGASTKGKGVDFARKRILHHLNRAINEYGSDFYALVFDFKSFFDNITHKSCFDVLSHTFKDKYITGLALGIIKSYPITELENRPDFPAKNQMLHNLRTNKGIGICLGSQISQVMALAVPNKLDHFVKDKCSVRYYIRYMDDGVIFHKSKEYLKSLYEKLKVVAESIGLHFNPKKTRIVKISKGFTFMKVKYVVTKEGKIIRSLVRSGIVRMRRKLKKFKRKYDEGELSLDDIYASMQSWLAHSKVAKSYHTKKRMLKLYDKLFGGYMLTRKYRHTQNKLHSERMVA